MERAAVLGAGSWGTTLAWLLGEKGNQTYLWMRSCELKGSIAENHENLTYLPGVLLPRTLVPSCSLKETLEGASIIVSAVPSHGLRAVLEQAKPFIQKDSIIVSATKGIEEGTNLTPSGIIKETLSGASYGAIVVLSGPSFAKEVAVRLPAAISAASESAEAASVIQKAFSTSFFRVYTNHDVPGVETGGAMKNVIAIASGISDGLGLGNNARAALITRGIAEITRLGVRLGAKAQTFAGLSGLGDLVLTCTGRMSRNYTVGFDIGQGRSLGEITGSMRMVAEGVRTSRAARDLARSLGIEMPITEAVCGVLYEGKPPREAVYELMVRELKGE